MKFTILLLITCCLFSVTSHAQSTYTLRGEVIDTAARSKLQNTSIVVLNAKDSVLQAFTRADESGSFEINNLSKGKYIVLITYPGYADYAEPFTLDSAKKIINFGRLNMILKSRLLADVIIKGTRAAIKIKGDTTEFNARSYVIQPNDKVEDLLRQLPGIEVDKDGKITAQGQAVNKVLVDGEEFFGDDPTLVTKNIRADMVDKVQLYDKKSDQAAFTGVDDDVKNKTINIVLKEDKKNGVFGKVNGNVGTDDYYEGQLQYNKFKSKSKFALYGTAADDGRTGLDFGDASNLGIGNNDIQFVDGGITITNSGNNDALDSFSGYYDGKGIPTTQSGGAHYDSKWNADKESINTNYKIGAIDVTGLSTTTTQQTLPTGTINTYGNQTFDNYAFRQKLDATYQVKLDTSTNLKVSADGTLRNFHVNNDYNTQTDTNGTLLNKNHRSVINHGDAQIFDVTAFYTKKFRKVGRTISWSLSEAYNKSDTKGYLNSEIDFYTPAKVVDSTNKIDQYKTTSTLSSVINSNITYSEPLNKNFTLLLNYGLAVNNSNTDRKSFDASAPGDYNIFDAEYSNNYKFNQLTNQLGAIVNYKSKRHILNFGTKASDVNFEQTDEYTGTVLKRSFINWAPQAMYQYKFSQQESFRFNYTGNTTQPTIDQIQPVLVNTDPLNITLGNPTLKPSFTNRFNMSYNSYQVLSSQRIFIFANYSVTSNAIVNNTSTSSTGANTTQYVNLANHQPQNYSLYSSVGRNVKALDMELGLNLNASGNITYSYINNALDMGKNESYNIALNIGKYVQNKYDFSLNGGPVYTFSTMSLNPNSNNNAPGFSSNGRFDVYLPLKFGAGSDARYTYTAKTAVFDAEYRTIWNAYVYKTFLKDDKLKLSLSVNDLLNQNTNFSRGITGNTTTQTNVTGIKRFFMLSVTWDFTKFGTLPAKN